MAPVDLVFKAIAHPARRGIISLLAVRTRSVKELTAEFGMSQPAISQHLKELADAHLVFSRSVGRERHYNLTPRPLRHVFEWSAKYRALTDPSGHVWTFLASVDKRKQRAGKREHHGR